MDIKSESLAALLKYIIKKYNLPLAPVIEESDVEDVKFNYEVTKETFTNNEGKLAINKYSLHERDPKLVPWDHEMVHICSNKTLNYPVTKNYKFQDGSRMFFPHFAISYRDNLLMPAFYDFCLFIYTIYCLHLKKNEDVLLCMLITTKHKKPTKWSKKAVAYYVEKYVSDDTKFLGPLRDCVVTWLKT